MQNRPASRSLCDSPGESTWERRPEVIERSQLVTSPSAYAAEFLNSDGVEAMVCSPPHSPLVPSNIDNFPSKVDDLKTIWSPLYKLQKFKTFKVKGQAAGVYKNAGLFSYVRIYGAGHEVPAYKV